MADQYIDVFETSEYGQHFLDASAGLVGASPLVDVEAVRRKVRESMLRVAGEVSAAGLSRGDVRAGRRDAGEATEAGRQEGQRFFYYLSSQDGTVAFDFEAFFPGRRLGSVSRMKAADVKAMLDRVIIGFGVEANRDLPEAAVWQERLRGCRDKLAAALAGKGVARVGSVALTASLREARLEFLRSYNQVAKPLIRGLLAHLGRRSQYRSYFLDLQVSETRSSGWNEEEEEPDADVSEEGAA